MRDSIAIPGSLTWLRLARVARLLAALTFAWLTIDGAAAETSWVGIALTAGTLVLCPWLGRAKQRIGARLGSRATYGEGTQNMLCAMLAAAVLVGLAANTLFALWWLDPTVALAIAVVCVREGRKAWLGEQCRCATCA